MRDAKTVQQGTRFDFTIAHPSSGSMHRRQRNAPQAWPILYRDSVGDAAFDGYFLVRRAFSYASRTSGAFAAVSDHTSPLHKGSVATPLLPKT